MGASETISPSSTKSKLYGPEFKEKSLRKLIVYVAQVELRSTQEVVPSVVLMLILWALEYGLLKNKQHDLGIA